MESGRAQPHCYELCQGRLRRFSVFSFLLTDSVFSVLCVFLSGRGRVLKRIPGVGKALAIAHPAIRARPQRGRHKLTHRVIARKRARPISKSGRCQPQCGCGRAPFQNCSVGLWHGLKLRSGLSGQALNSDHLPAQVLGFYSSGAPAPQIHGQLAGHGDDGFLAFGSGGSGVGQHWPPFLNQFAIPLPDHQSPGQFDQRGAQ